MPSLLSININFIVVVLIIHTVLTSITILITKQYNASSSTRPLFLGQMNFLVILFPDLL